MLPGKLRAVIINDRCKEEKLKMAETITVRGRRADDWPAIYEIFRHEAVFRQTPNLPYASPDTVREQVAAPADDWHYLVAEIRLPDGHLQVVGELGLHHLTRRRVRHRGYFFIVVHPDYHGRGVGSALMTAMLNLTDNWLGLRRVELEVYTDNAPAIALYEKFGFEREATLRRYAIRDGAFVDAYVMARINDSLGGRRKADLPPSPAQPRAGWRPTAAEVVVRGGCADDWQDLYEVFRTESVYANTMQLPNPSPDFIRRRMADPPKSFTSLVAEVEGHAVGHAGLWTAEGRRAHLATLGIMVHPDYQGMGVGSALMAALVDMAGNWLQVRRLELETYPDNAPAIRLYETFGFEHEGRMRDYAFQNGVYVDTLKMSRLFD
jgi:putative acetyltransferase